MEETGGAAGVPAAGVKGRNKFCIFDGESMGKAAEVCSYKTKSATRGIITGLLEKEVIEKQGNGPATRYVLIEKDL